MFKLSFETNIGYNRKNVSRFHAHSRTGRINSRYILDYENEVFYRSASEKILEEARYNLATHVMSNGVELIIASEKGKPIGKVAVNSHPNSTTQQFYKPFTLAPSTLTNQMILTLPLVKQDTLNSPDNSFITKICLSTYTYRTTYVDKGSSKVVSKEMVISNSLTEERKDLHASNPLVREDTFSKTPELVVAMLPTTYHYYNTIDRGQTEITPIVVTSEYTIINTITNPGNLLNLLDPSKDLSRTINTTTEYDVFRKPSYVTKKNNLTQVVIRESIPAPISTHTNTIFDLILGKTTSLKRTDDLLIYSTKVLLETYTFCSSMFRSSLTEKSSNIDIKRTVCKSDPSVPTQKKNLLTHVLKNIVTNTVSSSLLNADLIVSLKSELMLKKGKNQRQTIITMATLLGGEIIQVTAMNIFEKPNTFTTSKDYFNLAMNAINATLNSSEHKLAFSSKEPNYSENIGKISEKTSIQINNNKNNTDFTLSESENSEVYVKDNTKLNPMYSSLVSQVNIIGNVNLERFRPMFNVVTHLLKKQFINIQKTEHNRKTFIKRKKKNNKVHSNKSFTTDTQTVSATIENPVYIPLEQNESGTSKIKYLSSRDIEQKQADSLAKLRINTLHMYPPKIEVKPNCLRDILTKLSHARKSVESAKIFNNALGNTGIPIRPGEVITASANVIFGKPNVDVNVGSTTTNYRHLTQFKSLYPSIPLHSTMLHNSPFHKKIIIMEYASILKPPPPQMPLQYITTFKSQLERATEKNMFPSIDLVQKYSSIDRYSSEPLTSLNSAFYSKHILDVFRMPQIFGTSLPARKSYIILSNTFDYSFIHDCSLNTLKPTLSYQTPLIVSTFSGLEQVNMKNDVLSHTINMHARPLTFKRESENIPYATAVQGHFNSFLLDRVKITMNDAKVDVQLTPNHKRIFPVEHTDLVSDETLTKFKQRNNNLKFVNIWKQNGTNKFSKNKVPYQFTHDSYATYDKPTMSIREIFNESVKQTVPDQNADNSNESLHFLKFISSKEYHHKDKTGSIKWVSMVKHISDITMPKSNEKTTNYMMSSNKQFHTGNSNKRFLATDEQFNLRPFIEDTIDSVNSKVVPKTSIINAVQSTLTGSLPIFERPQLRSSIFKESKSLRLTTNDDLELKTHLVKTMNSHQYSSVIPVTNYTFILKSIREPLSDSNKIMRVSTLQIKCQHKDCKNNLLTALKDDIKKLEPSEMLHDDNSAFKKTMEWDIISMHVKNSKLINHLISTSKHARKTTNYFNILKPTKSNSFGPKNLSVIKTSTTNPIFIRLQKVLTSSRINMQTQVISENRVLQFSQISKHFNTSDYIEQPTSVIIGPSSSRDVDSSKTQISLRHSKHSVFRNETSLPVILESNPDEVMNAARESNSRPIGAVPVGSLANTNYLKKSISADACHPPCRSNKNEICVTYANNTQSSNLCDCRPSFGRMFPDRPCKPTYTYEMNIQVYWPRNHSLKVNDGKKNSTTEFHHINRVLLEAADRMVMQSDYRDIFHDVQLRNIFLEKDTLTATFLLQLSENSDENQLTSVFKKYLRQSNFSIGSTGLHPSQRRIKLLAFKDFDECGNENFNDCSINAHCFNLIGSYTCSCKEGYIDIADNALYQGRHCSDKTIGCDRCNYNGKCIKEPVDKGHQAITTCKCYSWYTGTKCQVNLKIIIIILFTSGTILSTLLLFLFLLINTKLQKHGNLKTRPLFTAASILHPSIIKSNDGETNSKFTENVKSTSKKKPNSVNNFKHLSLQEKRATRNCKVVSARNISNDFKTIREIEEYDFSHCSTDLSPDHKEQNDRSLTLMIPRAKFCIFQKAFLNYNANRSIIDNEQQNIMHKDDANILPCRPGLALNCKNHSKSSTLSDINIYRGISTKRSSLVSAGFEVSAVVTDKNVLEIPILHNMTSFNEAYDVDEDNAISLIEDANTMTERDLGSTFLLPHTHLYKPDKIPCDLAGIYSS